MCAFGGRDFDTLYVTSIRPQKEADLVDQPWAGAVFALRPGVQGLPETEFAGGAATRQLAQNLQQPQHVSTK
jgi:hypothetical protein